MGFITMKDGKSGAHAEKIIDPGGDTVWVKNGSSTTPIKKNDIAYMQDVKVETNTDQKK